MTIFGILLWTLILLLGYFIITFRRCISLMRRWRFMIFGRRLPKTIEEICKDFGMEYSSSPWVNIEDRCISMERLSRGNMALVVSKRVEYKVVEKHPDFEIYKIAAMTAPFDNELVDDLGVFLFGRDKYTLQPFLYRCPPHLFNADIETCRRWNLQINDKDILIEV